MRRDKIEGIYDLVKVTRIISWQVLDMNGFFLYVCVFKMGICSCKGETFLIVYSFPTQGLRLILLLQ